MSASLNDSKTTLIGAEHDAKSISKDVQEEDRNAPALDLDKEVRINLDALASLPQPIGLDPFRCLSEPTLLSINKAPCWKVGEFSVRDVETGRPVFECKGKFNVWAEKNIYDAAGNHLFHMSTKFWSMSRKTTVTHPDGTEAFVVAAETWAMKPQLHATFTDKLTGKPVEIYLDGTYKRGKGRVLMDGQEIAQLYREKLLKDERRVVIAPNADTALIFTVVLVFDMVLYELVASSSILAPVIWATSY